MTFITEKDLYCYKVMLFGLKNIGATYQKLVNTVFKDQIDRNMELYVDNMIIKSQNLIERLEDLKETLNTLKKYNMRLNLNKYAFDVASSKFLNYMIN